MEKKRDFWFWSKLVWLFFSDLLAGLLCVRDLVPTGLWYELLQPVQPDGRVGVGQRPRLHRGHQQLHLHPGQGSSHCISWCSLVNGMILKDMICKICIFQKKNTLLPSKNLLWPFGLRSSIKSILFSNIFWPSFTMNGETRYSQIYLSQWESIPQILWHIM